MGWNSKPKGRIPLAYPLFVLGGFMLGPLSVRLE